MVRLARNDERGAVLEHTGCRGYGETTGGEQVAVQRVIDQSPWIRTQRLHARAHKLLHPAVLLLEMLRAQEHAFLPDHAVSPAHRPNFPRSDCIFAQRRDACTDYFVGCSVIADLPMFSASLVGPLLAAAAIARHCA